MKKHLILIIFTLSANILFAQKQGQEKMDSLISVLNKIEVDTAKVNTFNALAQELARNNPDTAIYFGQQAIDLAKKINYVYGLAEGYTWIGNAYINIGEYDQAHAILNNAFSNCEKLLTIAQVGNRLKFLKLKSKIFKYFGILYKGQGKYPKALNYYLSALKVSEEIDDQKNIGSILGSIAVIYQYQGKYNEAYKFYNNAIKILDKSGDLLGMANTYNNIGVILKEQGKLSESLQYYFTAKEIFEKLSDKKGISKCYGNIGNIYMEQKNYDEALKNHKASLTLCKEIGDKQGIATAYVNIGNIFSQQNKFKEALIFAKLALPISLQLGDLEAIRACYFDMAILDSVNSNFANAFEHFKLYIIYRDSLFNKENTKKTVQLQMQYDFDKKEAATKAEQEKKDLLTQTEIQKEKALRNNVATGGGAIILASFVSFIFYRRKRDAQMQSDISAARVKTMTAQIEKHFVFGSLSSVKNLIAENPEKANELITRSSKFLRTTLNLSESTTISLKQELEATENYLQIEKIHHDDKFDFKLNIEEGVNTEEILVPPLVFQPIVENSIKHGFHGIDYKGKITINISRSGSQLICKIADNGVGFKSKPDSDHKSFGTKLTKERLELFNKLQKQKAFFNIEPLTQGVLVTLTLPIYSV